MPSTSLRWLAAAVVVLGCVIRVLHLDADPHYYGWWGHVFDEGRWVEQARTMALEGKLPQSFGPNAMVAPLFEVGTAIVFILTGVSHLTARLIPAVAGSALLILVWLWLRNRVSPSAALLGVCLVAFEGDLVILSRIAVPEMPALLVTTAAFLLLSTAPPTRFGLAAAGVLTAAGLGMKITTLFTALVFIAVAMALRGPGAGLRRRLGDAGWFTLGLAMPALILGPPVLLAAQYFGIDVLGRLHNFMYFFGLRDAYSIFSLPYQAIDSPIVVTSALALWAAGLAAMASRDHDTPDFRWIRACATWSGLYIIVFTLQAYFPSRYRLHVLIPFALLTALSVTRLERDGLAGIATFIAERSGLRRLGPVALVMLPIGVQLAALVTPATALVGIDPERLSTRMVMTVVGWVAATAIGWPRLSEAGVVRAVVGFSVVGALIHFLYWIVDPFSVAFMLDAAGSVPGRLVMLAAAAGLTAWVIRVVDAQRRPLPALMIAGAFALAWTAHLWPGLASPQFTARDASAKLGTLLAGQSGICQSRAEGLFITNDLIYAPLPLPIDRTDPPDVIVSELPLVADDGFLLEHYTVTHEFEVYVPASHPWPPLPSSVCDGEGQCFAILHPRAKDPRFTINAKATP